MCRRDAFRTAGVLDSELEISDCFHCSACVPVDRVLSVRHFVIRENSLRACKQLIL